MPEATPLPAVVIMRISGRGDVTMDGPSSFQTARMQFTCYGRSVEQAEQLAAAVRGVLEGVQETLPDGTQVDVAELVLESETFAEAPFVFQTPLDFQFFFREPSS